MELAFRTYHNPRPPFTFDLMLQIGQQLPRVADEASSSPLLYDEYVASLDPAGDWPKELVAWHRQTSRWLPEPELTWWLKQFAAEPNLQPMSLGWWRRRGLALTCASDGYQVVGAGMLTVVVGSLHQGRGAYYGTEFCYEIRGVVVAPEYRKQKVFSRLVQTLLAEARSLGQWPTFLATRNNALRGVIRRQLLTAPQIARRDLMNELVCWCPPGGRPCSECPELPGNTLWWDTHEPLPPGDTYDRFDYQE